MDDNAPPLPAVTTSNVVDMVRTMREDALRQAKMLEHVLVYLQHEAEQPQAMHESAPPSPAWSPPVQGVALIEPIPAARIRTLENRDGSLYYVDRLKATWPGRFYANHLKQIPVARGLVIWTWRTLYFMYARHVAVHFAAKNAKLWRPLIKLSDYVKTRNIPAIKFLEAEEIETPVPKVFPTEDQTHLASPHDRYNFPSIYVATISNALVYGGTNLVIAKEGVICHDLYDFERDFTSEELHARTLIEPRSGRIRWLLHDDAPDPIPAAAAFVDACASNYAHWMTEVLPRIVLFCAEERFLDVPIVVNDGLHKNIMESLFLVVGANREIITLPIGRALAVNKLHLTSVTGYVPFERRTNKLLGHSHGLFSARSFTTLRNHVTNLIENPELEDWPQKIYLRRNSGTRNVTNASEIEKLLYAEGYVIVEPEKLSFLQQASLFSNAKIIIASSGAAIANIIFCSPSSRIIIFVSKQPNTSYWYWQNMANSSGNSVQYILGETTAGTRQSIHDDFYISPIELLRAIN